jgi:hypothetical protein
MGAAVAAPERLKIRGEEKENDVAVWGPRVGMQNKETAGANYVLGIEILLLHLNNFVQGSNLSCSRWVQLFRKGYANEVPVARWCALTAPPGNAIHEEDRARAPRTDTLE